MRRKMKKNNKLFRLLLAFLFVFNVGFSATNLVFARNTNFIHVHLNGYDGNAKVDIVYNDGSMSTDEIIPLKSHGGKLYTTPDNKEYVTGYVKGILVNGNPVTYKTGVEAKGTINYWIGYDSLPNIKIDKSVYPTTAKPGDTVTYTMKVSSNVDLTNVKITDTDLTLDDFDGDIGALEAGTTIERTGTYTIPGDSQEDISNTASVTGDYDDETELTDEDTALLKLDKANEPTPTIDLKKSVSPTTAKPGETVTYTMKVSSNVNLTEVNITDTDLALVGFNGNVGNLTANTPVERTGTYVVPSEAVTGSTINNTASVTGKYGETTVNDTDSALLTVKEATIDPTPQIDLEKSVYPTTAKPGETVTYTMKVSSNVNLTEVNITDTDLTLVGFNGNVGNLTANTPVERTGTYVVPSEAVAGSTISNTASVTGKYGETTVNDTDGALLTVTEVPTNPIPDIKIVKNVNVTKPYPGQIVIYTMTVTSNVNLTNVIVTDSKIPTLNGSIGDLAANTPKSVSGTYMVPLGTSDGTIIDNTASVTGNYGEQVLKDSDTVNITVKVNQGNPEEPVPGLSITKKADRSSAHRGDTIVYTITVKNTGDTNLEGIKVVDGMLNLNQSISLKSGESKTFDNLNYLVPSDQPYGTLTNTATATCDDLNASDTADVQIVHKSSGGGSSSNDHNNGGTTIDDGTTPLGPADLPALLVTKTVDKASAAPGDTVKYTITVKNSGNVDLTNVAVTDQLVGLNETVATLKAGDSKTFSKDYVVPQNAAGSIKNTALAETVYNGNKVTANGSAVTYIQEEVIPDNTPLGDAKFPTETINDSKTPLAEAKLPKTGGIPMSDLVVLGSGLAALGFVLRKRQ